MIKIEVNSNGTKNNADIYIEGKKGEVKGEFITLLEALESNEASRGFLQFAIDYRINSLIKEYKELEDDGEL